jgi:hypothetical protein
MEFQNLHLEGFLSIVLSIVVVLFSTKQLRKLKGNGRADTLKLRKQRHQEGEREDGA